MREVSCLTHTFTATTALALAPASDGLDRAGGEIVPAKKNGAQPTVPVILVWLRPVVKANTELTENVVDAEFGY